MTSHELSANLKNTAREKLAGKYGNAILIVVLYSLIVFVGQELITVPVTFISAFVSMLTGNGEVGTGYYIVVFLLQTTFSIFANIMNTGLALFFLNMACNRTYSISNLFYGYRYMFKKSFAISAILVGINTIVMLPYDICYFMYLGDSTGSTNWLYYMLIAMCICLFVSIIVSLFFSQTYYLLLDFPRYSVKQILSLSIRIMKGRKLKYLFVDLSFLPLELLSMLSLNIGFLWVTPYRMLTMALFFLDAMKSTDKRSVDTSEV